MTRFTILLLAAATLVSVLPARAAVVGVPTGQRLRVTNSIARTQQRNNAAIRHVQRSIAATRRRQF